MGVPGARLRQVSLWVGDHATLELIEYANRPVVEHLARPQPPPGCRPRVLPRRRRADEEGGARGGTACSFYSDVNVVDDGPLAGWRWCYFSDPDGLALELVEIAYYLEDERRAASEEYLRTRPSRDQVQAVRA